jgi:hypothetical protein
VAEEMSSTRRFRDDSPRFLAREEHVEDGGADGVHNKAWERSNRRRRMKSGELGFASGKN